MAVISHAVNQENNIGIEEIHQWRIAQVLKLVHRLRDTPVKVWMQDNKDFTALQCSLHTTYTSERHWNLLASRGLLRTSRAKETREMWDARAMNCTLLEAQVSYPDRR
jgi:hypothetical protein